jgi:hypothetical protein
MFVVAVCSGRAVILRNGLGGREGTSSRRGGRLLGEMGGNGTMPLLSTTTDGTLVAKIESVGRNYDTLAQRMAEIQATLAMLAANSALSAAE